MTQERSDRIREALQQAFSPVEILVKDQSHLHAGHAGARDGKGHYDVTIIADAFAGKSRIQRHRMIFGALGAMMQDEIHALRIKAFAPGER